MFSKSRSMFSKCRSMVSKDRSMFSKDRSMFLTMDAGFINTGVLTQMAPHKYCHALLNVFLLLVNTWDQIFQGGTEYFIFSAEIFSLGGPNISSGGTKLGGGPNFS